MIRDWLAYLESVGPSLTLEQRAAVIRFASNLIDDGAADRVAAHRARLRHEREWERDQLRSGPDAERELGRLEREP